MTVQLIKKPNIDDLMFMKQCVWITDINKRGKVPLSLPSEELLHKLLRARHSPIRMLSFGFKIKGIPSNIATHLTRHRFTDCFVSSLRNDRQNIMDGDKAPRDTPVDMIISFNAEALMVVANKRLCMKAAPKTREVVQMMCDAVVKEFPAFEGLSVPMCEYCGGVCHEIEPCGRWD